MPGGQLTYDSEALSGLLVLSRSDLLRFLGVLLLPCALLLRPTLFGGSTTAYGLMAVTFALSIYLLAQLRARPFVLSRLNASVMVSSYLLWGYLGSQALFMGSTNVDYAIKATIAHLVAITVFALALSAPLANRAFFRSFVYLLALLGLSAMVTTALSLIVPLNLLYLFHLNIEDYRYAGDVFFPFSVKYSNFTSSGFVFSRFLGVFREPGIAQAFFAWSLVYAWAHRMPIWLSVGLIGGTVLTLSTGGIVTVLLISGLWLMMKRRARFTLRSIFLYLFAFVMLCIIPIAFLYAPYIGLITKSETHLESITDRTTNAVDGIEDAIRNPLGSGFYSRTTEGSAISLLAATGQIGVLGLLLALLVFFSPSFVLKRKTRRIALVAVTPLVLTSLFAQPILDAPLVYLLLFADFRANQG